MRRRGLDLEALRRAVWRVPAREATVTDVVSGQSDFSLSRRDLLTLAGMAAVALPPFEKTIAPALLGHVEYAVSARRVAFRLRGRDRWVLDLARFAGSPRLAVRRGDEALRVEVKGARFPGTELPAGMVYEMRRGLTGWRMKVKLALGGFSADVPLETWLAGIKPARSRVRFSRTAVKLSNGARLELSGTGEADLHPDWRLEIHGKGLATLSGMGEDLKADKVTIQVLERGAPSTMKSPPARRTLLVLDRGDAAWPLEEALPAPAIGRVSAADNAFDEIRLEVGETPAGAKRAVFLACAAATAAATAAASGGATASGAAESRSAAGPGRAKYVPAVRLSRDDGGDFELGLRNPRYAVTVEPSGEQAAFLADFDEEPVWLHVDGYTLELAGTPDCPPFEVVSRGGTVRRARCEPAVLRAYVPLPDALTEPAPLAEGARLAFVPGGVKLAQLMRVPPATRIEKPAPKAGAAAPAAQKPAPAARPTVVQPKRVILPPVAALKVKPGTRPSVVMGIPPVTVIRPDDLLYLSFYFVNLAAQGSPAALHRVKTGEPSFVVVEFQPQHVAEQAFLEESPEFGQMASQNLPRPPVPVKARMAGRSRLVFRVPDSVTSIPYTLASLLDWGKLELSVVPLALPAPPPKRVMIPSFAGKAYRAPAPSVAPKGPVLAPMKVPMAPQSGPLRPSEGPASGGEALAAADSGAAAGDDAPERAAGPRIAMAAETLLAQARPTIERAPAARVAPARPQVSAARPGVRFVYMGIREPLFQETSIEAPYHLMLSPHAGVGWVHSTGKVVHDGRAELWHTRMGVKTSDGKLYDHKYEYVVKDGKLVVGAVSPAGDILGYRRTMRAVWSPDYSKTLPQHPANPNTARPFLMSLDQRDRCELVWLTADSSIEDWRQRVIETERLMLTSLGAWMNVRYGADLPKSTGLSVEEWRHRMAMGRDQYVTVVYAGYLFPFGHQASLVKVTERKFNKTSMGPVAYLRQRYFLRVREPEKLYPAYGQATDARQMPFRRVRVLTLVTPTLRNPNDSAVPKVGGVLCSTQAAFWPRVGNEFFRFHMTGEDWDGQKVDFQTPVIFVGVENVKGTSKNAGNLRVVPFDEPAMNLVVQHYNTRSPAIIGRRQSPVQGQRMAFAESGKPGDTTLQCDQLTFEAELDDPHGRKPWQDLEANNQPRFYPRLGSAKVRLIAVEQATGRQAPTEIRVHPTYISAGWASAAPNLPEVFAELWDYAGGKSSQVPMGFKADKSGGLAVPDIGIQGLSRQFGTVSDLGNLMGGNFDPTKFFSKAATLLGAVKLADIVKNIFGPDQVPTLKTEVERDNKGVPKAIVTTLSWKPKVESWPKTKPIFAAKSSTTMTLTATLRTEFSLTGGISEPSVKIVGKLTKFSLNLVPIGDWDYFIRLDFDGINFTANPGKKPDVKCDFGGMAFGGPLSFVDTLRRFIPTDGFGDGPTLDVSTSGIKAGYTLAIPSIGVGVFTLANINLSANLDLPFTGDPLKLRFSFCKKDNPFKLSVSMFGGGGFFSITLSTKEVDNIEASFEFGGNFSFDIGVASGGVHVMAGIYFSWTTDGVHLEGYLRMGGCLSVLGLVKVSVEFYMSLTYDTTGGGKRVYGRAKLTIEIEILFFSTSVDLEVERQFAGSSSTAHLDTTRYAMLMAAAGDRPSAGRLGVRAGRVADDTAPPQHRITFAEQMSADDWAAYAGAFQ